MMRQGFGLVQTLIVIVLISGIMTIAMKYAKISVKQTSDAYAKESAVLFMDSATELALLAISGKERSSGCLKDITITSPDERYLANITITHYYLLNGSDDCSYCGVLCSPIQTEDSHGMVMLEMVVETNTSHPKNQGKAIRLMRRTLQHP